MYKNEKNVLEMCYIAPTQDMVFFDKAVFGYMMFVCDLGTAASNGIVMQMSLPKIFCVFHSTY